jgi:hypothetical protein
MKHCVAEYDCPKCKEPHLGSGMAMIDFIVCYDCYYKFHKELEPEIIKLVAWYFKGES